MKKIKILLILLVAFFLCSCNKKEYKLIEITGEELVENLIVKQNNFIFAIIDSSESDYENFFKDLNSIVKSANINIYYVDYLHLSNEAATTLFNYYTTDFTTNGIFVNQNKSLVVAAEYTDFKTAYSLVKDKAFTNEVYFVDDSIKKEYIKEAKELMEENKISEAHDKLNKAWNLKEAKDEYNSNKYYNLINAWERIEYTTSIPEKTKYTSIIFFTNTNYYAVQKTEASSEEFTIPTTLDDFETIYYKVKDDIIYTSNREKGYYEKTYKINDISDKYFQLTDIKNNKKMTFTRRKNV
ncbi:MAG: hypothetical protein ACI4XM_04190 [Candidatus Coprovivens sp.]